MQVLPGGPQKVHCVSLSSSQMLNCPVWCFCQVFTQPQTQAPSPVWRPLEWEWFGPHTLHTLSPGLPWGWEVLSLLSLLAPLWSPFLSLVHTSTALPSHPEGLCHHVDPIPWLRTTGLALRNRSLPLASLPSNPILLGAKRLLETASPHLGRQSQTDSDSQPLLHGDCS